MTDPFNTPLMGDKQSLNTLNDARDSRTIGKKKKGASKKARRPSSLYKAGIELFSSKGFTFELCPEGPHLKHKIFIPDAPKQVKGINYPHAFCPLREIQDLEDFNSLEAILEMAEEDVREFWQPLVHPKAGDSDLLSFAERKLKMDSVKAKNKIHDAIEYGHSFDPSGSLTGAPPCIHPRIWVPAREWFSPEVQRVKFEDVFTIFPEAERELLKLIIGRIGVGRSGHLPPGFTETVSHTSRMAAVIVGKSAGLGKSSVFNYLIQALDKAGFQTGAFKSLDDKFGLSRVASADVAYKDDSSIDSLKKLLASETTKTLVTGGNLQTEEKFEKAREFRPKCVLIVNSNKWQPEISYDLDPGIIDRMKLISTYLEVEVMRRLNMEVSDLSMDSPDLRPYSHLPWLAERLGVSIESIFLWCLRLCTDHFWEVINDRSDPKINRLQVEVRHWTTRLRVKFKSETTQSFMNAALLASMVRSGGNWRPREMTYNILADAISDLWFLGTDPSGNKFINCLKKDWEKNGRSGTHPYQAIRDLRWESVTAGVAAIGSQSGNTQVPDRDKTSKVLKLMYLRDGFSLNSGYSFAIEAWKTSLFDKNTLKSICDRCLECVDEWDKKRLVNRKVFLTPEYLWMDSPEYDPTRAEELKNQEKEKLQNAN